MRIAVLVETRIWGGLEAHSVDLVRVLIEAGHHAFIACVGGETADVFRRASASDVQLVVIQPPPRRSFFGWRRALRALDADAVIHQKGTLWTGSVALDAALRARYARFIAVEHLEPPRLPPLSRRRHLGILPGLGLWWYRWRAAGFLRSLGPQQTVCVSEAVRRALASQYRFRPGRLVTIRNGIDLQRFRDDPARRGAARRAWGVPAGGFVFGSVRRFVPEKGLDLAIEAFASLPDLGPERGPFLVLVGEGREAAALEALAGRLGVASRVIFPGFTSEPWNAYPGFDVFVIPSRIEALGVVVAEAMASGCDVIGSAVGGIPEMIASPDLGTLVPPGDVPALAAAMADRLRTASADRAARRRIARAFVAEHFDSRTQCRRLVALVAGEQPAALRSSTAACA